MSGTIKINGVKLKISDNNSSDIALASFSGYIGLAGELAVKFGDPTGKTIGLIASISDGVITRIFDKNLNSPKDYTSIVGTFATCFPFKVFI